MHNNLAQLTLHLQRCDCHTGKHKMQTTQRAATDVCGRSIQIEQHAQKFKLLPIQLQQPFAAALPLSPAFGRGDAHTDHPAAACEQAAGAPGPGWAAKQSTS